MVIATGGCASLASREYACRETTNKLNLYGFANMLFGNTLQLGDCAISDTLRIETGEYYSLFKKEIDWAVQTEKARKNGGPTELHNFAKALKCDQESYALFSEMIFKNKDEIFEEDFQRSARGVTKSILQKITEDPTLKNHCRT